jgi:signal transduction histidine kinase
MLGKLDATANINTSGVGLGLSTCKKIAEALHGKIFIVDNEVEIQRQAEFYTDWIDNSS